MYYRKFGKGKPNPLPFSMIDRQMDQVNHKLDAYWYRESIINSTAKKITDGRTDKVNYIIPSLQKINYLLQKGGVGCAKNP